MKIQNSKRKLIQVKFSQIIIAIAKYKALKKDWRRMQLLVDELKNKNYSQCNKYESQLKILSQKDAHISELKATWDSLTKRIKDLEKKLFKFENTSEVWNLDPYEMHQKMRYFESMYEMT